MSAIRSFRATDASRFPEYRRLIQVLGLVASIRFAISAVAFLAILSLAGILLPQVPPQIRGDPVALHGWLESERRTFGPAVDSLYRLGFFDVFHSVWMDAGLALLAVSVLTCTVRRFKPTWSSVTRPVKAVPDAYFDHARHRLATTSTVEPTALEQVLRRHRYAVDRWQTDNAEWFFADRFAWTRLGTIVSHVAIVLLIVGAMVTHFTAFSTRLFVSEGASEPVFPFGHSPAINVSLESATATLGVSGSPIDFHSDLTITSDSDLVKSCVVTATQPCSYDGLRIRQALFFPFGADLEVRDVDSERVLYRDTIALGSNTPAPRVRISDIQGQVLVDEFLTLTSVIQDVPGTLLRVPDGRSLWVGFAPDQQGQPRIVIFEPDSGGDSLQLVVPLGGSEVERGLRYSFADLQTWPAATLTSLPRPGGDGTTAAPVVAQLENPLAVTGSGSDRPVLRLAGIGPETLSLNPGEHVRVGDLEYTFVAQRAFLGLEVTRDRGEALIWIGSAMLFAGLCITLWLPQRRLWAKIGRDGLRIAGLAPRMANFRNEMEAMATEAKGWSPTTAQDHVRHGR